MHTNQPSVFNYGAHFFGNQFSTSPLPSPFEHSPTSLTLVFFFVPNLGQGLSSQATSTSVSAERIVRKARDCRGTMETDVAVDKSYSINMSIDDEDLTESEPEAELNDKPDSSNSSKSETRGNSGSPVSPVPETGVNGDRVDVALRRPKPSTRKSHSDHSSPCALLHPGTTHKTFAERIADPPPPGQADPATTFAARIGANRSAPATQWRTPPSRPAPSRLKECNPKKERGGTAKARRAGAGGSGGGGPDRRPMRRARSADDVALLGSSSRLNALAKSSPARSSASSTTRFFSSSSSPLPLPSSSSSGPSLRAGRLSPPMPPVSESPTETLTDDQLHGKLTKLPSQSRSRAMRRAERQALLEVGGVTGGRCLERSMSSSSVLSAGGGSLSGSSVGASSSSSGGGGGSSSTSGYSSSCGSRGSARRSSGSSIGSSRSSNSCLGSNTGCGWGNSLSRGSGEGSANGRSVSASSVAPSGSDVRVVTPGPRPVRCAPPPPPLPLFFFR